MASAQCCISCNDTEEDKQIKLKCQRHFKCMDCIDKMERDYFSCEICSQVVKTTEKVFVYMDNSNVWIEAKKLLQSGKGDNRVRIDVGRLLKIVAAGREVAEARLYGSEPPPLDTVWKEMKERGWEVITEKRSQITDKEKQVDTRIVADITKLVCKKVPASSTIVLISGDADIIPAIDVAIEEHWRVEVYMWKHALSAKLKKFSNDKCTFHYLDEFHSEILFNSMKFPIANNKKLLAVVRANGVVCKMAPGAFKHTGNTPTKKWCREVENKFKKKFQLFWMEDLDTQTVGYDLLVLVFIDIQAASFKIADIITSQKETINIKHVKEIETYLQYEHKSETNSPIIHMTNQYTLLDIEEEESKILQIIGLSDQTPPQVDLPSVHSQSETVDKVADKDDDIVDEIDEKSIEEWHTVEYKRKTKKPKQLYSQLCEKGINCHDGLNCKYKHSEADKETFKADIGRKFFYPKSRLCHHYPYCHKAADKCSFAHGEEDALCYKCNTKGHFSKKCTQMCN